MSKDTVLLLDGNYLVIETIRGYYDDSNLVALRIFTKAELLEYLYKNWRQVKRHTLHQMGILGDKDRWSNSVEIEGIYRLAETENLNYISESVFVPKVLLDKMKKHVDNQNLEYKELQEQRDREELARLKAKYDV